MLEFIIGVAIGAAFAPFWMMIWNWLLSFAPIKKVVDAVVNFFKGTSGS